MVPHYSVAMIEWQCAALQPRLVWDKQIADYVQMCSCHQSLNAHAMAALQTTHATMSRSRTRLQICPVNRHWPENNPVTLWQ